MGIEIKKTDQELVRLTHRGFYVYVFVMFRTSQRISLNPVGTLSSGNIEKTLVGACPTYTQFPPSKEHALGIF